MKKERKVVLDSVSAIQQCEGNKRDDVRPSALHASRGKGGRKTSTLCRQSAMTPATNVVAGSRNIIIVD